MFGCFENISYYCKVHSFVFVFRIFLYIHIESFRVQFFNKEARRSFMNNGGSSKKCQHFQLSLSFGNLTFQNLFYKYCDINIFNAINEFNIFILLDCLVFTLVQGVGVLILFYPGHPGGRCPLVPPPAGTSRTPRAPSSQQRAGASRPPEIGWIKIAIFIPGTRFILRTRIFSYIYFF